ncbi:hypothetical protein KL910_002778 [Ogataea haglerorum]|nr:hypothetical protein KL910_002778 [Ogataea haglerorum]KAG7790464.1 hypothetical protein KL945_001345 [Ogataea haglerorum]
MSSPSIAVDNYHWALSPGIESILVALASLEPDPRIAMSSFLYHLANAGSTRQVDGCLTPNSIEPVRRLQSSNNKENDMSDVSDMGLVKKIETTASISTTGSSEMASSTIPSPPLSPYTRGTTFDESDARFAQLLTPKPVKRYLATELPKQEPQQEQPVLREITVNWDKKRSFPVEDLNDTTLYINPYGDLKTPGYKKRQLRFLCQYQLNAASKKTVPAVSAMSYRYRTTPRVKEYVSSDIETDRPRTRRLVRENSVALESDDSATSRPMTPRKRKPAAKRFDSPSTASPPPYNFDYKAIPDYSPPLSTLPNNSRCLKTEWKGQAMDLSEDPLVGELHPAEVQLASTLRLPPNVYLDSKRRIFFEKVKRLRANLPFRRTDAQKACKIDVNKASRLYAAFEKIGWLDDYRFDEYLQE